MEPFLKRYLNSKASESDSIGDPIRIYDVMREISSAYRNWAGEVVRCAILEIESQPFLNQIADEVRALCRQAARRETQRFVTKRLRLCQGRMRIEFQEAIREKIFLDELLYRLPAHLTNAQIVPIAKLLESSRN